MEPMGRALGCCGLSLERNEVVGAGWFQGLVRHSANVAILK